MELVYQPHCIHHGLFRYKTLLLLMLFVFISVLTVKARCPCAHTLSYLGYLSRTELVGVFFVLLVVSDKEEDAEVLHCTCPNSISGNLPETCTGIHVT